jgi:hypothetical protein
LAIVAECRQSLLLFQNLSLSREKVGSVRSLVEVTLMEVVFNYQIFNVVLCFGWGSRHQTSSCQIGIVIINFDTITM